MRGLPISLFGTSRGVKVESWKKHKENFNSGRHNGQEKMTLFLEKRNLQAKKVCILFSKEYSKVNSKRRWPCCPPLWHKQHFFNREVVHVDKLIPLISKGYSKGYYSVFENILSFILSSMSTCVSGYKSHGILLVD